MRFRKLPDAFPDFGQRIAAVGREMLGDAKRRKKLRIVRQNFCGCAATIKFTEQPGDGFHHNRVGITGKETLPVANLGDKPELGQATGNQVGIGARFGRERRKVSGAFDEPGKTILPVFQGGQFGGEMLLFFREVHGAERISISLWRLLFYGRWCRRRLRSPGNWSGFTRLGLRTTRFLATRLMARRLVRMRVMMRGRRRALRLDAAERTAQFVQLPLIGELLTLGDFDKLKDFVHLVVQFLERLGNERGMFHGLGNGRGRGGAEISGFHPLALADGNARRWLGRALVATKVTAVIAPVFPAKVTTVFAAFVPAGFARLGRFRGGRGCGFSQRLRLVNFGGRRVLVGTEALGRFGMRLAETTGRLGFMLGVGRMLLGGRR